MSGPPPAKDLLHLALPCDSVAPRLARDALRGVAELGPVLDDALLVVSELVTNAVIHSGCTSDETIILDASAVGTCVRIAVRDPGHSAQIPASPRDPPPAGGGLGLRLVARITRRWGVERHVGRVVWAELAVH